MRCPHLEWNIYKISVIYIGVYTKLINLIYEKTKLSIHFELAVVNVAVVNTLRPRRNRRHFADDIFKYVFMNENVWISIKISLKIVPTGPINNIRALVQIMAWRRPGDKSLSEPKVVKSLTHICVTRPQWVNALLMIFSLLTIALLWNKFLTLGVIYLWWLPGVGDLD